VLDDSAEKAFFSGRLTQNGCIIILDARQNFKFLRHQTRQFVGVLFQIIQYPVNFIDKFLSFSQFSKFSTCSEHLSDQSSNGREEECTGNVNEGKLPTQYSYFHRQAANRP
jgi:hypothetical protein